jgi:hypothetical protein
MAPRRFLERLRSRRIPALGLVLAGAGLALAVLAIATSWRRLGRRGRGVVEERLREGGLRGGDASLGAGDRHGHGPAPPVRHRVGHRLGDRARRGSLRRHGHGHARGDGVGARHGHRVGDGNGARSRARLCRRQHAAGGATPRAEGRPAGGASRGRAARRGASARRGPRRRAGRGRTRLPGREPVSAPTWRPGGSGRASRRAPAMPRSAVRGNRPGGERHRAGDG